MDRHHGADAVVRPLPMTDAMDRSEQGVRDRLDFEEKRPSNVAPQTTRFSHRLQRRRAGKSEVIVYDYVDRQVPMLVRMFARRLKTYTALGYKVDMPIASIGAGPSPTQKAGDATQSLDYEHPASY